MGQASDNERIKLRANFLNNVAAGSVVGGAAIPYISFFQNGNHIWPLSLEIGKIAVAAIIAFAIAFTFRREANSEIKKLID